MNISVITPVYNEAENIKEFYSRITGTLDGITEQYEVIFVNDGSTDKSSELISLISENDNRFKVIELSKNFGKDIALTAGLDFSLGEVVIIIDADLQDPPELIPELVKKWQEGYDVVYATRKKFKKETVFKKIFSYFFHRIMKQLSHTEIPLNSGDYRLMTRQAADALKKFREQRRFMKGLFSCIGFSQTGIYYERDKRFGGKNNKSFLKLWNLAVDAITSLSFLPLQVSSFAGVLIAIASVLYAFYIFVKTALSGSPIPEYPSLIVAITFLGGIQLISLGVIGEYIARIYMESKNRPLYFIKELKNFNKDNFIGGQAKVKRYF